MPTRTALLDTNAVMEIKIDVRGAARKQGWHLTTTPWSFFERLRHLEDEQDFARARGQLMQFRGIKIVDKPLDRFVAERQAATEPRTWGSDMTREVLSKISVADSIEDFESMTFEDTAGNARSLENTVDTICTILKREKTRFQQLITKIIRGIQSGEVRVSTAEERHQAVLDMLVAGASSFRDTEGLDYKSHASDSEILTFEYLYHAYTLLRAIAQKKISGNTCPMNDFVDGQICAYVPLDRQGCVVTADKNSIRALSEARALLADVRLGKRVGLGKRAAYTLAHPDLLLPGGQS